MRPSVRTLFALQFLLILPLLCQAQHSSSESARRGSTGSARPASSDITGVGHNTWHIKQLESKTTVGLDPLPQFGIAGTPKRTVTALTMLIPTDWSFQVSQDQPAQYDCNFTTGRLGVMAMSPDKRTLLLVRPAYATVWSNDRGLLQQIAADNQQFRQLKQYCTIEQPQPLANRIGAMAKAILPNATLTGGMEPIPWLSNQLGGMLQQANQNLAQEAARSGRPAPKMTAEAGRIHLTTQDPSGQQEGYLYVLRTERTDVLPSGGVFVTTDVPMQFITGAPMGKLQADEPLFQTVVSSISIHPEYQAESLQVAANMMQIREITRQRLQQIASQMAADNARTAARIADIHSGIAQYRSQVMSNVAANRSAALQHSSQQFALYMGDQAIYKDTATGHNVQLPSGSDHVWASTTGNTDEYVLTDSPSYNPNGQLGSASWTQMQLQH